MYKLKVLIKNSFYTTLAIIFLVVNRKKRFVKQSKIVVEFLNQIPTSSKKSLDSIKLLENWHQAEKLWNEGFYQISVQLRKEILHEIYSYHELLDSSHSPRFLSPEFSGPFGHNGILGIHILGQRLNILPNFTRILPVDKKTKEREIIQSMNESLEFMDYTSVNKLDFDPINWHHFDRLQLMKTHTGFIDQYQLLEEAYAIGNISKKNPVLKLRDQYIEKAEHDLNKIGLPRNSWFVSLHIRNDSDFYGRRSQPISSFIPSIKRIAELGGFVIRIGGPEMEQFPPLPNLIDITKRSELMGLHSYILAHAMFHLGTCSGPSTVAPLFGTPVLMTNCTSLGRNTSSLSENSIYLPKKYFEKNRYWSFRKILSSSEGYSEVNVNQRNKNLALISNTETEILNATNEILDAITKSTLIPSQFDLTVKKIRQESNAVSFGRFSESFLEENVDWFLRDEL